MNTALRMEALKSRIQAYQDVATHQVPVISEAEEFDIETALERELAKGGLHIVLAAGGLETEGEPAKGGMKSNRNLVVTLAYIPGLTPPPVNVLSLSEALCEWLHGHSSGGVWFSVIGEGSVPADADVCGRQITLKFSDVLRANRSQTT